MKNREDAYICATVMVDKLSEAFSQYYYFILLANGQSKQYIYCLYYGIAKIKVSVMGFSPILGEEFIMGVE